MFFTRIRELIENRDANISSSRAPKVLPNCMRSIRLLEDLKNEYANAQESRSMTKNEYRYWNKPPILNIVGVKEKGNHLQCFTDYHLYDIENNLSEDLVNYKKTMEN